MKLDETIPGGRYLVGGQLVNANGEVITETSLAPSPGADDVSEIADVRVGTSAILAVLDGNVTTVETAVSGIDDVDALVALLEAEQNGKTRKGVRAAIETRIAELGGVE